MIAVIGDSQQTASIALHRAAGFEHVGTLKSVGFKFDRWLDSVLMQRPLDQEQTGRRKSSACYPATKLTDLSIARSTDRAHGRAARLDRSPRSH